MGGQKLCELCELTTQTHTQMLSSHCITPYTQITLMVTAKESPSPQTQQNQQSKCSWQRLRACSSRDGFCPCTARAGTVLGVRALSCGCLHAAHGAQRTVHSPAGHVPDPKAMMLGLWQVCACFSTLCFDIFPMQLPQHEPLWDERQRLLLPALTGAPVPPGCGSSWVLLQHPQLMLLTDPAQSCSTGLPGALLGGLGRGGQRGPPQLGTSWAAPTAPPALKARGAEMPLRMQPSGRAEVWGFWP